MLGDFYIGNTLPFYGFNTFNQPQFFGGYNVPVTSVFNFQIPIYQKPNNNIFGFLFENNNLKLDRTLAKSNFHPDARTVQEEIPEVKTVKETVPEVRTVPIKAVETSKPVSKPVQVSAPKAVKPTTKPDRPFLRKVKLIAKKLNCNYQDLLAVMNAESGLKANAVNPNSGATGLIQFMPSTAKSLGTTTEELKRMNPLEQLDYVEKYLIRSKKAAGFKPNEHLSAGQLYALVFLPGRAKREILTEAGEIFYKANRNVDVNKDGKITEEDLAYRVNKFRVDDSVLA